MIKQELKWYGIPDICQLDLFPETGVADFVEFVQINFDDFGNPYFII